MLKHLIHQIQIQHKQMNLIILKIKQRILLQIQVVLIIKKMKELLQMMEFIGVSLK